MAVLGAGYGDEGKGLLVDALAAAAMRPMMVRANGGAQAGHTVVAPDGRRHVFSHVGAGSFAGADTFLGPDFVANPVLFAQERQLLAALGLAPDILADPHASVTTPFDMLVNQAVEQSRGAGRHGSVGVGFGETIERCLAPAHALRIGDLGRGRAWLRRCLHAIRDDYVPARLRALGVVPPPEFSRWCADALLAEAFLDDVDTFLRAVQPASPVVLRQAGTVIFEGAQGLGLDAERGAFPHVTRSRTGIAGLLPLLAPARITGLDVTYATRAYVTRHGAGPLLHERESAPSPRVVDRTNLPHPFQGTLRFADLDLDRLRDAIRADLADAPPGVALDAGLAVTCLDQSDGSFDVVMNGAVGRIAASDLPAVAARHCGLVLHAESWGETRADVVWHHAMAEGLAA